MNHTSNQRQGALSPETVSVGHVPSPEALQKRMMSETTDLHQPPPERQAMDLTR
jgi:hypothetical protein